MNEIISRYQNLPQSFDNTLGLIQSILNTRLTPNYRKIWVQGNNLGTTRLIFTIFPNNNENYRFISLSVKNFRRFRPDGDSETELSLINNFISSLVELNGIIK